MNLHERFWHKQHCYGFLSKDLAILTSTVHCGYPEGIKEAAAADLYLCSAAMAVTRDLPQVVHW